MALTEADITKHIGDARDRETHLVWFRNLVAKINEAKAKSTKVDIDSAVPITKPPDHFHRLIPAGYRIEHCDQCGILRRCSFRECRWCDHFVCSRC